MITEMEIESDFQIAPAILYKYRFFDPRKRHIQTVTNAELWFANASDFNDPFDTGFEYNYEGLHGPLGEKWARNAAERHQQGLPPAEREQFAMARLAKLRGDEKEFNRMRALAIQHNYDTFGICSLCAARDNLLLWAHYSNSHTGFAAGLSVDHLDSVSKALVKTDRLLELHQVKYLEEIPNANFFEEMINLEESKYITKMLSTKSPDWSYEKEWRLVLWDGVNSALQLPNDTIKEVILGCRIASNDKKDLLALCRKHIPGAKVFQAEKQRDRFALSIKPIT